MREETEELESARRESERLAREVTRLRDELHAAKRGLECQHASSMVFGAVKQAVGVIDGCVLGDRHGLDVSHLPAAYRRALRTSRVGQRKSRAAARQLVRHGVMDETMHYVGKPYSMLALSVKVRRVLDSASAARQKKCRRLAGRRAALRELGPLVERLAAGSERNVAFLYETLGVPVAAGILYPMFGLLHSPTLASAAMSLSSVSVVANALRLRKAVLETGNATPGSALGGRSFGDRGGRLSGLSRTSFQS